MESCPAVLSVGRRCVDFGYSFHWPAGGAPYLVRPDGARVELEVEGYVPYLPEPPARKGRASREGSSKSTALPASEAEASEQESAGDSGESGEVDRPARIAEATSLEHLMTCLLYTSDAADE